MIPVDRLFVGLLIASSCHGDSGLAPITDEPSTPLDTDSTHSDALPDDNVPDDVLVGGVKGRICAPNGHSWVADAKVSIEHEYGLSTTYTNAEGYFDLEGIPAGERVLVIQKGSFQNQVPVYIPPNETIELAEEECFEPDDLNIAVITGAYDDIGSLLSGLGLTYTSFDGFGNAGANFLSDAAKMEDYDIVFLNCGMSFDPILNNQAEIAQNLRNYVSAGGSVYASDWAYFVIEFTWSDMVDFRGTDSSFESVLVGSSGEYTVSVYDPTMITALGGSEARIVYDLDGWATPIGVGSGSSTMVYGEYEYLEPPFYTQSYTDSGPLAVSLDYGDGRVIYTTFHNEAQVTEDMRVLLHEIIWAL